MPPEPHSVVEAFDIVDIEEYLSHSDGREIDFSNFTFLQSHEASLEASNSQTEANEESSQVSSVTIDLVVERNPSEGACQYKGKK